MSTKNKAHKKLTPAEKLTLMEIARLGPDPSSNYGTLAEYVGVTTRTIGNVISSLRARGLIEVSASRSKPWRVITEKGRELL